MNHLSDEELAARCWHGDRRAMDALVSRYHAKLLDFSFRHLRDRDASADIAQSAFIKAFASAARYRPTASFKTWLYTIALNLIRDECRRRGRRKESLYSELEDGAPIPEIAAGDSPEQTVLDRAAGSMVWRAVDALSENQRSAVILRFRHQLTYEETAEVMGAPVGTVKSWVHHALRALRESLEPVRCGE